MKKVSVAQIILVVVLVLAVGVGIGIQAGVVKIPSFLKRNVEVYPSSTPETEIAPMQTSVPIIKPAPTSTPVITASPAPVSQPSSQNPSTQTGTPGLHYTVPTNNSWTPWTSYYYFNNDVQGTGFPRHFGKDRYETAKKAEKPILWTRTDFYRSIEIDPCLAAGCIYYTQLESGHIFFSTLEGKTDEDKANYAHQLFRSSPSYWQAVVQDFEKYIDSNYSFNITDINGKYSLSYMIPYSASFDKNAPLLIWGNPENTTGHWFELVSINGKDGKGSIVLRFRMECGYQFPTDKATSGTRGTPINPTPVPTPVPTPIPTPVPTEQPGKKNPAAGSYPQGNAPIGGHDSSNTHYDVDYFQPTEPTVEAPIIASPEPAKPNQENIQPAPKPVEPVIENPAPAPIVEGNHTTFISPITTVEPNIPQSIVADPQGNIFVITDESLSDGEITIID